VAMTKTTRKVNFRYLHSVGRVTSVEKVDTKRCSIVVARVGGEKFNGNCNHCGKYGHKKTHCWSLEKTRRIIRKEKWIKTRKVLEQ